MYDGISFDSKRELARYKQLKLLERANEITNLELQKRFILQDGFRFNDKAIRPITYVADFCYYDVKKKCYIVEDTKGHRTTDYKIKKKMFIKRYGMDIIEI